MLSVAGLTLWLVTKVGDVAILFSILADGLAALPTVIKAYRFPESEIAWPWIVTAFGVLLSLLTIKDWTFANYAFILYILIVNTTIFLLAQFRPHSRTGQPSRDELTTA